MNKRLFAVIALILALSITLTAASYAAGTTQAKEGFGTKMKNFWRNLLGYPAKVTEQSASVVADTGKRGVNVVTKEVKRVAEVTSGDVAKTKELVTEPITGTAETGYKAVEGTIKVPSEAAKEDAPSEGTATQNK